MTQTISSDNYIAYKDTNILRTNTVWHEMLGWNSLLTVRMIDSSAVTIIIQIAPWTASVNRTKSGHVILFYGLAHNDSPLSVECSDMIGTTPDDELNHFIHCLTNLALLSSKCFWESYWGVAMRRTKILEMPHLQECRLWGQHCSGSLPKESSIIVSWSEYVGVYNTTYMGWWVLENIVSK